MIALLFLVICGFAYAGGKLLFEEEKGNIAIRLQTQEEFTLDKSTLEKIRYNLREVKARLATGETALVYFSNIENALGEYPLLSVSNPVAVNEREVWQETLVRHHVVDSIPESINRTYRFVEGMEPPPFGAFTCRYE